MAAEQQEQKKFRRKLPCSNHPFVVAVAYCEMCGKPICRSCLGYYKGNQICSAECWTARMLQESAEIFGKQDRRKKWGTRIAAAAGFAGILVILWIVSFFFLYPAFFNRAGARIWTITYTPSCFGFTMGGPSDGTFFLLNNDGLLQAVDLLSGKERWSARLPEGHENCKAVPVDADRIAIHFSNRIALMRSDRTKPVWEHTVSQPYLTAGPTFADETFFCASSSRQASSKTDPDARRKQCTDVVAIEASKGSRLWNVSIEGIFSDAILVEAHTLYVLGYALGNVHPIVDDSLQVSSPALRKENDSAFVSHLFAFNAATGKLKWQTELEEQYSRVPLLRPEGIVVSTRDFIYLVSRAGEIVWRYPLSEQTISRIESFGKLLFVLTEDGMFACIDSANGRRNWMCKVDLKADRIFFEPPNIYLCGKSFGNYSTGIADDKFSARTTAGASSENTLYGIDIDSGRRYISRTVPGDSSFSKGVLYSLATISENPDGSRSAATGNPRLLSTFSAYRCFTGEKVWEVFVDGANCEMAMTNEIAIIKVPGKAAPGESNQGTVQLLGIRIK